MSTITEAEVRTALAQVENPEVRRPIAEIGMVKSISVVDNNDMAMEIYLTIAGCPMKDTIIGRTEEALNDIEDVGNVTVTTDVMNDGQHREFHNAIRDTASGPMIPFAQPDSRARVFAMASGKGGVGKSSVTVNLTVALATKGLSVGVLDAGVYGHFIPHVMGSEEKPHQIDDMIMPPQAHDVSPISIGHFVDDNAPVVWRGLMPRRVVRQFLADIFRGDLDVLLLDLPPGTGDIAISVAQLVSNAELLIVTIPQMTAAEVIECTGTISLQMRQRIASVIENISWMEVPDGSKMEVFGTGGGVTATRRPTQITSGKVELLDQMPLDAELHEGGDRGTPIVLSRPDSDAGGALSAIADKLVVRRESPTGKSLDLGVTPRQAFALRRSQRRRPWKPLEVSTGRRFCLPMTFAFALIDTLLTDSHAAAHRQVNSVATNGGHLLLLTPIRVIDCVYDTSGGAVRVTDCVYVKNGRQVQAVNASPLAVGNALRPLQIVVVDPGLHPAGLLRLLRLLWLLWCLLYLLLTGLGNWILPRFRLPGWLLNRLRD